MALAESITALILCGGRGERMGGVDKGLLSLDNVALVEHLIRRIRPQVAGRILLSCNRNFLEYERLGYPCFPDEIPDAGPLSGILTALSQLQTEYLLIAPCDTPLLPENLAERLFLALHNSDAAVAIANDGERPQFLHLLVRSDVHDSIVRQLQRKQWAVHKWLAGLKTIEVDFSDHPDAFLNINQRPDLERCKKLLAGDTA